MIYDSGKMSLEHLLLSRYPSLDVMNGKSVEPTNPESINLLLLHLGLEMGSEQAPSAFIMSAFARLISAFAYLLSTFACLMSILFCRMSAFAWLMLAFSLSYVCLAHVSIFLSYVVEAAARGEGLEFGG